MDVTQFDARAFKSVMIRKLTFNDNFTLCSDCGFIINGNNMSKKYWVLVLCVLGNTVAIPPPKSSFAAWPSLVNTAPRCPPVPPLQDLKQHLKDLTNIKLKFDPEFLNKLGKENLEKCKDNIVELNADEIKNVDEINIEEEETEENSTQVTAAKKEAVIPTFIPIFRPRKIVTKTENPNSPIVNNLIQNPKDNKNLIVQYVKSGLHKPVFGIGQSRNDKEDTLGTSDEYIDIINSTPPDKGSLSTQTLALNIVTSNTTTKDSNPLNTTPNNDFGNTVSENTFPINSDSSDSVNNTWQASQLNNSNTFSSNALPINDIPVNMPPNAVLSNYNNDVTFKTVPSDTDLLNPYFNTVTSNTDPTNVISMTNEPISTEIPIYRAPSNPLPKREGCFCISAANGLPASGIPFVPSSVYSPAFYYSLPIGGGCSFSNAANSVPFDTIPSNVFSSKMPANARTSLLSLSNTIPSNTSPLHPKSSNSIPLHPASVSSSNLKLECKQSAAQCNDGTPQSNLVFFKPETVSVMNVEGDLLKKITMTVLVPTSVSRLNL